MKRKYEAMKLSILEMEAKDVFLLASGEGAEPDAGWPDGWRE